MSDLRGGWTALRALVRERGWRLAALFVLFRMLDKVSAGHVRLVPYALVAQPLGVDLNPVRDDPQTVVYQVDAQDPVVAQFPRPAHINARRWQAGASCHVVKVKDQFAGTLWLQRNAYEEDEVRALFVLADPGQSVWDFDVYVAPRYRLGRTMARLWKAVDAELCAGGVRWSFSRISLLNPESLKSHARLGAVTVRRAWFLCAGGLQLSVWGGAPYVHLGWSAQQRPRIVLHAPPRL
jgi:hypothetical protein